MSSKCAQPFTLFEIQYHAALSPATLFEGTSGQAEYIAQNKQQQHV